MHKINRLFTATSISVLLVTVERFSFTTKIVLQPYSFMRLHEMVQMTVLILLTVVIPFLTLAAITDDFQTIRAKKGLMFFVLWIAGMYLYATGNGVHELASFLYNHFCNMKSFTNENLQCQGFFFNDYYTGNILYFIGGYAMVVSTLFLEKYRPNDIFQKSDQRTLAINAVIYSLAIFAYTAFDVVSVGLIYTVGTALTALLFFMKVRRHMLRFPVITYTTLAYCLGSLAGIVVRIMR